jgi:hypothetical protein
MALKAGVVFSQKVKEQRYAQGLSGNPHRELTGILKDTPSVF